MSIEAQISQLVGTFVSDVTKLARRAAVDVLTGALSSTGAQVAPGPRTRGTSAATTAPQPRRRRRKGEKRAQGDIASLQQTLRDHIRKNPGERVEQINKALGTVTSDVRLPLAKLIEAGEVKTKGSRRATKYFPS